MKPNKKEMDMEMKGITIYEVMEWHEHLSDVAANLPSKGYAVYEQLIGIYGKSLAGFKEIKGNDNTKYEVSVIPLGKAPNAIVFTIKENDGSLSLSNEVAVFDGVGSPVFFTLHLDEEYGYKKGRYTQMRTLPESARKANDRIRMIQEGIEKARKKKREVEEKVGGLAISLDVMADVLGDDDDLRIGYRRVDEANDLIDFDYENITMTLNRRYREYAGEPYWEVSGNIEIHDEDDEVIIARGELL